jgi:PAS/PAC sensor hybrid histidine kinase (EC 2.7.13.3)
VRADANRLQRLLENLFRNAIEHGGEDVTLRIGALDDGFFVEDDGPGIPSDQQEEVLKAGYSSDEEGTGLGLSIVKTIVDAHGWSLALTEGRDGGARFEVTGAEVDRE